MGLSRNDQKRLILDILKSHQADHITRRNELEQLQRLTSTMQTEALDFTELKTLNEIETYCQNESRNPDGACETSTDDLDSLIDKVETT